MEAEILRQLIEGDETLTVEFKLSPPRPAELAERLCGFANGQGGYLILGVEDGSRRLAGVKDTKLALDTVLRAARLLQPSLVLDPPEPEVLILDGVKLVVATVPVNRGILYQAGGTYWIRHGTSTHPMSSGEIEAFMYQSGRLKWEMLPAPDATLDDLNLELVEEFLRHTRATESHRAGRFSDMEQVLLSLRCATEVPLGNGLPFGNPLALAAVRGRLSRDEVAVVPTNAGILMFGRHPQSQIMQSEVICVYHKDNLGLTKWHDRKILRGTVKELIDDAFEFISRYVPVPAHLEGLHRVDVPAYPLEVLREAIVNAVVHRDYSLSGEFIRIFYYPDRIEIRNPGKLLPGLELAQLSRGMAPSKLRNHVLVSLLRELPGGYIEHIGSGVRLMNARMKDWQLPVPVFEQAGEFAVILYGPDSAQARQNEPVAIRGSSPKQQDISPIRETEESENGAEGLVLTKSQKAQQERFKLALSYLRQHGRINNLQYRTLTGVSDRTALRDLEKMVEQGIIRATGETSGRYYRLA